MMMMMMMMTIMTMILIMVMAMWKIANDLEKEWMLQASCLKHVCEEKGAESYTRCPVVSVYSKLCSARGHDLDIASIPALHECGEAFSMRKLSLLRELN
jgi:hypothetical protein